MESEDGDKRPDNIIALFSPESLDKELSELEGKVSELSDYFKKLSRRFDSGIDSMQEKNEREKIGFTSEFILLFDDMVGNINNYRNRSETLGVYADKLGDAKVGENKKDDLIQRIRENLKQIESHFNPRKERLDKFVELYIKVK